MCVVLQFQCKLQIKDTLIITRKDIKSKTRLTNLANIDHGDKQISKKQICLYSQVFELGFSWEHSLRHTQYLIMTKVPEKYDIYQSYMSLKNMTFINHACDNLLRSLLCQTG